jgi:hypothetical protein
LGIAALTPQREPSGFESTVDPARKESSMNQQSSSPRDADRGKTADTGARRPYDPIIGGGYKDVDELNAAFDRRARRKRRKSEPLLGRDLPREEG